MTLNAENRHDLFLAHRSALVDYAERLMGCRAAAEDIVQDAYLRFAPDRTTGDTARQTLAYLYRIVRNLAFDMLKRRKVERRLNLHDQPFWIVPQPTETPEQTALLSDEVLVACAVLDGLPTEIRIAVEMYRFGGATLEQVAAHLGISVATAHRHVRTAMVKIAIALDRQNA